MTSRALLTQLQGKQAYLKERRQKLELEYAVGSMLVEDLTVARDIVNTVTQVTQNQIKVFIEDVVSLALKTVFGDAFAFKVDYEIRRNKSEASLYIMENGQKFEPRDECGCGVLDVASIGLRLSLWALATPKPADILLLDEPSRHLGEGNRQQFGALLQKVSEMFALQIIMITHDTALASCADRTYSVTKVNGISEVELLS